MAQNLRKCTLGEKIRNRVLLPKNNHLHSPENDGEYFLKSESELFKYERQCKFSFSLPTCAVNFLSIFIARFLKILCSAEGTGPQIGDQICARGT